MTESEVTLGETISEVLVGRKVVEAADSKLTLDDGSVIAFEGYGDCCAWGDVERLATIDNAITNVRVVEGEEGDFSLTFYALAEGSVDTEVIHLVGNEGSGYYTFGVSVSLNGVEIGRTDW